VGDISIDPSFFPAVKVQRGAVEYHINNHLDLGPAVSGGFFPSLGNKSTSKKGKKMAKKDSFEVRIKDGRTEYAYDKHGNYKPKVVDSVQEYDTFAEALAEFAYTVSDEYNESKVSLVFVPGKKK